MDIYNQPLVCIILVNYNGYEDTKDCVKSIRDISYKNYKIVIVDNCSNPEQQDKLHNDESLNNAAVIIYAKKNNGFSEGNNIGIEWAKKIGADYVLLLNNDTVVTPLFLTELVDCAERHSDAAITIGSIKYYSDPENYWYFGGNYNRDIGVTTVCDYVDNPPKNEINVTFATGCLMLIKMSYIKTFGELSTDFFLYSEDTEYSLRALNNGQLIYWQPTALIYHKVSRSTKTNSPFQQYYLIRNNLYIAKKYCRNFRKAERILLWNCAKSIIKRRYPLRTVADAYFDFRKGIKGRSVKY